MVKWKFFRCRKCDCMRNRRRNRKQRSNRSDLGDLSNEDSKILDSIKLGVCEARGISYLFREG